MEGPGKEELEGLDPELELNGDSSTAEDEKTITPGEPEEEPQPQAEEHVVFPDTPTDGGYGWVCVACVFFINFETWGLNSVSMSTALLIIEEVSFTQGFEKRAGIKIIFRNFVALFVKQALSTSILDIVRS